MRKILKKKLIVDCGGLRCEVVGILSIVKFYFDSNFIMFYQLYLDDV